MSSLTRITIPKFLLGVVFAALCLCASAWADGDGRCRHQGARLLAPADAGPAAVGLEQDLELEEATPLVEAPAVPSFARWLAACGRLRLVPTPGTETGAAPRPEDDPTLPRPPPA
jgi:hypothetical protein